MLSEFYIISSQKTYDSTRIPKHSRIRAIVIHGTRYLVRNILGRTVARGSSNKEKQQKRRGEAENKMNEEGRTTIQYKIQLSLRYNKRQHHTLSYSYY